MEGDDEVTVKLEPPDAVRAQFETETSHHTVNPDGDRAVVKTESEPIRWVVCGDVIKREKCRKDLVQQGRL